jgi:hypothetical protein
MRMPIPLLLLVTAACSTPPAPAAVSTTQALTPVEHLVRASMALRGMRPSLDDLKAVEADATKLPALVDGYLNSDAFGDTMRDLHNEALLVRTDTVVFPSGFPAIGALKGYDMQRINVSVQEEPLKLIEQVVMEDRPYSDIVTADFAMADGIVADVWGLQHSSDMGAWEKTQWPDSMPRAGVLSSPAMFNRHATTISNANRGRANAVAQALLCYDFSARDVQIDASINLADPAAVARAVKTDTACQSCHQTLDPLAAYFSIYMTIYVPSGTPSYPFTPWAAESITPPWIQYGGMTRSDPAFFGRRADGLKTLGQMIASDPRFTLCAARRFAAYFTQRRLEDISQETVAKLNRTFIDSGLNAKALARAIVLSDDFKAAYSTDAAEADTVVGYHKSRPEELLRMVKDLTGYVWQTDMDLELAGPGNGKVGRVELVTDSFLGFKVQAGGLDSYYVTLPSFTYNATTSLFLRQFAEETAQYTVETDLADGATPKLLTRIAANDTTEASVRAQLADLHARIYGRLDDKDSDAVGETYALFAAALDASHDAKRAWKVTLAAMLQDFAVAYY